MAQCAVSFFVVAEAEPQELPLDWSGHRTLGLIDLELQSACKETFQGMIAEDERAQILERSRRGK